MNNSNDEESELTLHKEALIQKELEYVLLLSKVEQNNYLGNKLYNLIVPINKLHAGKITGMLLNLGYSRVINLIYNPSELNNMVNEAIDVLKKHILREEAERLSKLTEYERKKILGDKLYPLIKAVNSDLPGDILEIFFEFETLDLLNLIDNPDKLTIRVKEAIDRLEKEGEICRQFPKTFLYIVEDCTQNNIWKQDILLGSGVAGNVYIACKGIDCEYVIKIQKENKDYYTEIQALLSLQNTNAVPVVFAAWTCENFGYFVMEKLYPCKYDTNFMWKEVGKKLDIIKQKGYLHLDTHNHNVMCNKHGEVLLIDFGYAVKRTEQGDKQEYPENPISESYGISLTWKYLEILQDYTYNKYFNPAAKNLDSITEEQKSAYEKSTEKYMDARKLFLEE